MVRGRGARDNIELRGPEKLSAALRWPFVIFQSAS